MSIHGKDQATLLEKWDDAIMDRFNRPEIFKEFVSKIVNKCEKERLLNTNEDIKMNWSLNDTILEKIGSNIEESYERDPRCESDKLYGNLMDKMERKKKEICFLMIIMEHF